MPSNLKSYDVFISYRRKLDTSTARLLYRELENLGYRVFLDVETLGPGPYGPAIMKYIERATNFVLIVSPGTLKRCANKEDWLGIEIARAIELKQKNNKRQIVPLRMPELIWPPDEKLPETIASIPAYQSIPYSDEYFSGMMDKLAKFLGEPEQEKPVPPPPPPELDTPLQTIGTHVIPTLVKAATVIAAPVLAAPVLAAAAKHLLSSREKGEPEE